MNHKGIKILKDYLNEKRQEKMREEAVENILSNSSTFIRDKNYIFKIVFYINVHILVTVRNLNFLRKILNISTILNIQKVN